MDKVLLFLQTNYQISFWIMAAIVFGLTFLIKLPIKAATKKLNEQARKGVNSIILLLPFGLGIGLQYLYGRFISGASLDIIEGVIIGGQSIAMYGIIERFFKVKVSNPYEETEEGKAVAEAVTETISDGKITTGEVANVVQAATGNQKTSVWDSIKNLFKAKDKTIVWLDKGEEKKEEDPLQNFLDNIGK